MPPPIKFKSEGYKLTDVAFVSRVQIPAGTYILQASIASITYTVTEELGTQAGTVTGSGNCPINTSVFDTLQAPPAQDPGWSQDNLGYNFKFTVHGSNFPDPGDYRVVFLLTPVGGGSAVPVQFLHHCFDY